MIPELLIATNTCVVPAETRRRLNAIAGRIISVCVDDRGHMLGQNGTTAAIRASEAFSGVTVQQVDGLWARLYGELDSASALPADWRGDDSEPPNAQAIHQARLALERSFIMDVQPSRVIPSAEGGVMVVFKGPAGQRANIEFFNDGTGFAAEGAESVTIWPVSAIEAGGRDLDNTIAFIRDSLRS